MARAPHTVTWLAAAAADLITLHSEDEKLAGAALAAVEDIARHRQRGKVLGGRDVCGDLSGFLRLRFDAPDQRPQRYRIVYRLTGEATRVEIIATRLRADHEICRQAAARTVPAPSPPSED